jgi:DNA-binding NarL/FixJ family response regulator
MKILIACSHKLVGQSLSLMLSSFPGGTPVECEVTQTETAVECALSWKPDLILVEAITDFASGFAATRQIYDMLPGARLVLLGTDDDEATVYEAISAGADGYLTCDTSAESMLRTLTGVLHGEVGLTRVAALRVIWQLRRVVAAQVVAKPVEVDVKLTPRESEVFELVRKGMRSREIANVLFIAEGTVYKHIHNILEKLNVHSRSQALVTTLQNHRIEPPAVDGQ